VEAKAMPRNAEVDRVAKVIKRARSEGEAWPLLVCDEVLILWDRWPMLRNSVDGRPTFAAWLRKHCTGRSWTPGKFKSVKAVVERLGESCRRTWTWPAAQWANNALSDEELFLVRRRYPDWLAGNDGHPLSKGQVQARVKAMRGDDNGRTKASEELG